MEISHYEECSVSSAQDCVEGPSVDVASALDKISLARREEIGNPEWKTTLELAAIWECSQRTARERAVKLSSSGVLEKREVIIDGHLAFQYRAKEIK